MTSLQIERLEKAYGSNQVLKGLDLTVTSGSFTAVLGPSGSGKTTLLRVIAGIERADRGLVQLGGRIVDDGQRHVPSDQRRVGYVPQEGSLFPHLNVAQNVAFGMDRQHRRAGRIEELLEMVGLAGMGRRYAHQLSGGERQRVALARTLAIDPELVLLDEPFSSLEANLRASVRADVRRVLLTAGATAVLVTHDQEEALSLADRVATIRAGRIGQYDTPQGLYSRPADPQLAKSLGESNLLRGVVDGKGVSTRLGLLPLEGDLVEAGAKVVVLIRPEQIELRAGGGDSDLTATVSEYEYYGHDAIVRVRPDWAHARALVARTAGTSEPFPIGSKVGLSVRGPVVAWRASADEVGGLVDQQDSSPAG
jgi:iron(III) transport system ATP-binding protein